MSFGKVKDSCVLADIVEIVVILAVESGHRPGYPFVHEAGLTDSWRNIAITLHPVGAGWHCKHFEA